MPAALLAALILGACQNAVAPSNWSGVPAGKGLVRIEAGFGAAGAGGANNVANSVAGVSRTVFPSMTGFSRYQYLFAKDGETAVDKPPDDSGLFELEAGRYTVTVNTFVGEETEPATEGTSGEFAITAGAETPPVKVSLTVAVETGEGAFSFTLSYPEDAELESFTLTRLAGEESFELAELGQDEGIGMNGKIFSGAQGGIGAGYWLAWVSLYRDDLHAGKSEVAHIYDGLSTGLNWTFSEDDFTAIPVVSGANEGPGTLREAIERVKAAGGGTIFIELPENGKVITLTAPSPQLSRSK
jgi:hypothetical protein